VSTPSPGALAKARLRGHHRRRRRECLAESAAGILATTRQHLPELLRGRPGRLGLYWPVGSEPDLRPLARDWPGPLALPAVDGARLVYRAWKPGDPLAGDACGIPAPAAGPAGCLQAEELAPEAMALLLLPALAVAPSGLRLGSGGGWYDRLRADPRWAAVPALAVLPAACVDPALPQDPWDIPLDGWIDERGCHLTAAGRRKVASS